MLEIKYLPGFKAMLVYIQDERIGNSDSWEYQGTFLCCFDMNQEVFSLTENRVLIDDEKGVLRLKDCNKGFIKYTKKRDIIALRTAYDRVSVVRSSELCEKNKLDEQVEDIMYETPLYKGKYGRIIDFDIVSRNKENKYVLAYSVYNEIDGSTQIKYKYTPYENE